MVCSERQIWETIRDMVEEADFVLSDDGFFNLYPIQEVDDIDILANYLEQISIAKDYIDIEMDDCTISGEMIELLDQKYDEIRECMFNLENELSEEELFLKFN